MFGIKVWTPFFFLQSIFFSSVQLIFKNPSLRSMKKVDTSRISFIWLNTRISKMKISSLIPQVLTLNFYHSDVIEFEQQIYASLLELCYVMIVRISCNRFNISLFKKNDFDLWQVNQAKQRCCTKKNVIFVILKNSRNQLICDVGFRPSSHSALGSLHFDTTLMCWSESRFGGFLGETQSKIFQYWLSLDEPSTRNKRRASLQRDKKIHHSALNMWSLSIVLS